MIILDGRKLAEEILEKLKKEAEGKNLKLAVVLVGEDPVSLIFVRGKEKACTKIGIDFELFRFPQTIKQQDLEKEIKKIAEDVSGLVIQLPLPKEINNREILNLIPLEKDVDVLSQEAFEKFKAGNSLIIPPVVAAIDCLLKEYKIDLKNKKIVLIGLGKLVGLPLSIWLAQKGIDFSVVDKSTENAGRIIKKADVIISGVGKPGLVTGAMVKEGAIVIDAGSALQDRKIVGDVDFSSVSKKASYITPVPGGVGLLTVALLLSNLIKLNSK